MRDASLSVSVSHPWKKKKKKNTIPARESGKRTLYSGDRDYRAFRLPSVVKRNPPRPDNRKQNSARARAQSPVPETHRAVSRKEDRGGESRRAGWNEVRSSPGAGSYLRLGQFTLIN